MTAPAQPDALLVCTTFPDRAVADAAVEALLAARLIACANILAPCRSVYRWEGKTEHAEEIPVLMKTTSARYAQLEAEIRRLHPYEVPEVLAFQAQNGFAGYVGWVAAETEPLP